MNEKLDKSLDTLLAHSSRHCIRFRLADYDFSAIPLADLRKLGSSMLDHFEGEMERLQAGSQRLAANGAPSGEEGAPSSDAIWRGRSHSR